MIRAMSVCSDVNEDKYVVLIIISNRILSPKGPWSIHCDLATSGGGPLHKLLK